MDINKGTLQNTRTGELGVKLFLVLAAGWILPIV